MNEYLNEGYSEGERWAKTAAYVELECARTFETRNKDGNIERDELENHQHLGDYFRDVLSDDPVLNSIVDERYFSAVADEWLKGWFEAVYTYGSFVDKAIAKAERGW